MRVKLWVVPNYYDDEVDQFAKLPLMPAERNRSSVVYHLDVKNEEEFDSQFGLFVLLKDEFEKAFGCGFESSLYLEKLGENDAGLYLSRLTLAELAKFNCMLEWK